MAYYIMFTNLFNKNSEKYWKICFKNIFEDIGVQQHNGEYKAMK